MDLAAAHAGDGAASGIAHGAELLAFTEAVLGDDESVLAATRRALRAVLGDDGLADTAATLGSYNSIVKVADATGIPLDEETATLTADLCAELGLADGKD